MKRNDWGKLAFTSIMGLLLSYAFVFLAALPIRHLRLTYGRKIFLLSSLVGFSALTALGLWQWAGVYMALCLLIGSYREMEEKQVSIFLASCFSIFSTSGLAFFAVATYSKFAGISIRSLLTQSATPMIEQLQQVPRLQSLSLNNFLWYIPSATIITLMVALFVSLTVSRLPRSRAEFIKMRMFKLPDWAIWAFILSLGATFIPSEESLLSLVSMNVLAVTLAAYFFQGIAVFTFFLDRLSIFGIWRLLAYFLAFFQMFLFISGLGILDYWFDFRVQTTSNFSKKTFT